jgi:Kef-type K+ transport system membrane component KefB
MHFAEIGVVLLLFMIGLEIQPFKLVVDAQTFVRTWWIAGSDLTTTLVFTFDWKVVGTV